MKRIIYTILMIIIIINSSFLINNCVSQWVAQTLPVNPHIIYCMKFFNKNTGWMSTGGLDNTYISKILKTTNGGDNWTIIKDSIRMYSFQVLDSVTVYGNVRNVQANESIYRTFNGGITWDSVSYSTILGYNSLFFMNIDTGYVGASDSFWGYLFKTTDGGMTLNQIYKDNNPSFGFGLNFLKDKVNGEFYGYCAASNAYMFKTTNSGYNWTQLASGLFNNTGGFYFINKDTGWVSNHDNFSHYYIQHTTNGGISWINQFTSIFNNYYPGGIYFSSYNKGWAGAQDGYLVYATTNGGQTWGRQITPNNRTVGLCFLDSLNGWNYCGYQSAPYISKTTNGGGVILGITKDSSSNIIPKYYTLKQNYPNPFNNSTIIEYSLIMKATIGINIYDISGRSVYDMTANNLEPGNYRLSLDFGALNFPSGIYFYNFIAINEKGIRQYSETKKLMYVK